MGFQTPDGNGNPEINFYVFSPCNTSTSACPGGTNGVVASPLLTGPEGSTNGPFEGAGGGLTISGGNYYVTVEPDGVNVTSPYIAAVNPSGPSVSQFYSNSQSLLCFPIGIDADPQTGNLLVADSCAGLAAIGADGTGLGVITSNALPYFVIVPQPAPAAQPAPAPPPPLFLSGSLPQAIADEPYSASFSASGGAPPYSYSASSLPAGIGINSNTGAIGGQTTQTGSFTVIVSVTDSTGATAIASATLTVAPPPPVSLSGASLGSFVTGTPISTVISASGGAPPYTYTLAGGALPPGLNLQSGGTLSGIPLTAGSYTFTVKATDSTGGTASGTFGITIALPPLTINAPLPLATGVVTIGYPTQTISAKGGTAPYTFVVSTGSLPAGLTLSSTGNIAGTPTAATSSGGTSFTVTAMDSSTPVAATGTANLSITVQPFTQNLVLSAGSLSFSLASGTTNLPPSQTVGVQLTMVSQPVGYTVAVQPSSATWLSTTSGSTTPGAVSVSLTQAALSLAGSTTPYTAGIVVTCTSGACAGNTQTVPVTLTVSSPPPQLSLQLTTLSFNTTSAAPQVVSQTLVVSNTGGGGIGFQSITCAAPWCTVSGIPGFLGAAVSAPLTVTVDPAGLSAGYYYTSVNIVSSAGKASVPVTFSIAPNGVLSLSPAGAEFTLPQGGQLTPGSFLVDITGLTPVSYSAAVAPGAPFLKIVNGSGMAAGTAPGTVSYAFDNSQIAQLTAGTYYGTIAVTAGGASNSPQSYEVVVNVTPPTTAVVPNPAPGGLIFLTQASAIPPAQTITVYSFTSAPTAFQTSASTNSGGNWLSVTPTTGSTSFDTPGTVSASVNPSGLKPGVYKGAVNFAFSAAAVRSVNVTLVVENTGSATTSAISPKDATGACTPSQLVPTSTGLVSNFAAPAAWPVPLGIALVDDCGNSISNGQIVATFSNGDPPLILTLADPTNPLPTYVATWTPEHTAGQITINARASAPSFSAVTTQIGGAVTPNNAPILADLAIANFYNPIGGAPLAPGALVQITGEYLAGQTMNAPSIPLPLTLAGTSVIIGGMQAPVSMVSPGQVNAQVPFELPAGQPYQVIVNANNALTTPQSFQAGAASPGLGVLPSGYVQAGHASGAAVTEAAPAAPGETISVYLVGMGATTIPVASGQPGPSGTFATTVINPALTLNGETTTVSFSGLIPGLVGVYQVNFAVPSDAPNGDLTLTLVENAFTSNSGLLPVHN